MRKSMFCFVDCHVPPAPSETDDHRQRAVSTPCIRNSRGGWKQGTFFRINTPLPAPPGRGTTGSVTCSRDEIPADSSTCVCIADRCGVQSMAQGGCSQRRRALHSVGTMASWGCYTGAAPRGMQPSTAPTMLAPGHTEVPSQYVSRGLQHEAHACGQQARRRAKATGPVQCT